MPNLLERVEELHRRVTEHDALQRQTTEDMLDFHSRLKELEVNRVPPGPPEHRDLVALDRHFDERCDRLSQRVDELEQRVPKPIPVVEPLAGDPGMAYMLEQIEGSLLDDALALLEQVKGIHAGGDSWRILARVDAFLARARVAKSVP